MEERPSFQQALEQVKICTEKKKKKERKRGEEEKNLDMALTP
jgi:hypothetical protein